MLKTAVVILALVTGAAAQALEVPLFEGAELLEESARDEGLHRLILEKNRRIQGNWQFEREQRIAGRIEHRTFQLDSSVSYRQIVTFYQDWVKSADVEVLFACDGRDCGSSNVWANDFFGDRRLYGPDGTQHYWALSKNNVFYMLYLIERGNQRIYLRISRIIPEGVSHAHTLTLDENCRHPDLSDFLQEQAERSLLLLVSIAGDDDQSRSVALAKRCGKQLSEKTGQKVWTLGLGSYNRQLQQVESNNIQLMTAP